MVNLIVAASHLRVLSSCSTELKVMPPWRPRGELVRRWSAICAPWSTESQASHGLDRQLDQLLTPTVRASKPVRAIEASRHQLGAQ